MISLLPYIPFFVIIAFDRDGSLKLVGEKLVDREVTARPWWVVVFVKQDDPT